MITKDLSEVPAVKNKNGKDKSFIQQSMIGYSKQYLLIKKTII